MMIVLAIIRLVESERRIIGTVVGSTAILGVAAVLARQPLADLGSWNLILFFVVLVGALVRRSMDSLTVLQRVKQAAVPGFPRIQRDFEAEPTVGIHCLGLTVRRSHHHGAGEIGIAIAGPQLLLCLRPR